MRSVSVGALPFEFTEAVSKKLKNKGMSGYEEVDEVTNSKNHKGETEAERDFVQHHKSSTYTPDMGYGAEKDTYDFDDSGDKKPGHQLDTDDDEDRGYEPVKEAEDNIPGGLAKGKDLIDLVKKYLLDTGLEINTEKISNFLDVANTDDYKNKVIRFQKSVKNFRLGYVPGVIKHYFHGSKKLKETVMKIRKLTGHIGAELLGVDLSKDLTPSLITDIRQALLDNLVIFFREQN